MVLQKEETKHYWTWYGVCLATDEILPPRALDRRLQEDWVRDAGECWTRSLRNLKKG